MSNQNPKCNGKCVSNGKICPQSPCNANLYHFGTHERIMEKYLLDENWDEAYYYFQNLLPMFNFDCDVKQLEALKREEKLDRNEDYPLGCRVFKISKDLRELKNKIKNHKKLGTSGISKAGGKRDDSDKIKFKKKLYNDFEILKHLAMDKRAKDAEKEQYHERLLELYDAAIQAHKLGLNVETGLGSALEKGFEFAAKGAGLETEELAELNEKRIKDAKSKKIAEEVKKQLI